MQIKDGVLVDIDDSDVINDRLITPEGVTEIASNTYRTFSISGYNSRRNNLKKIIFPESLVNIGDSAFPNCTNLTTLVLLRVTTIGDRAFFGCRNLSALMLPLGIISIGQLAFWVV